MSRPREVSRRELRGVQLDPSLSLAAKGLLHELLLRPPGVVLSRAELFETNRDAMTAIDSAVEELVRAGLVMKVPTPQAQPEPPQRRHQAAGPCRRQPQPEPDLDGAPVIGARPAPPWWEWQGWPVPPNEVAVLRPFRGRMVEREGRG